MIRPTFQAEMKAAKRQSTKSSSMSSSSSESVLVAEVLLMRSRASLSSRRCSSVALDGIDSDKTWSSSTALSKRRLAATGRRLLRCRISSDVVIDGWHAETYRNKDKCECIDSNVMQTSSNGRLTGSPRQCLLNLLHLYRSLYWMLQVTQTKPQLYEKNRHV